MLYVPYHQNDVIVSLNALEIQEAMSFGSQIYKSSQGRGLKDYRTFVRNGVDGERVQQLGSLAERAVAKALSLEWTAWINTFKKSDLHHNIEVRLIGVNGYGLRIYDRDVDNRRVVGIVIEKGKENEPYRIPGWINAIHGKKPEYKIDPLGRGHPMYAVPQNKLHHLDALRALIQKNTTEDKRMA